MGPFQILYPDKCDPSFQNLRRIHPYGPPSSFHMVPPHPSIWSPLHPSIWFPSSIHMVPLIHAYGPPHPCIWSPPHPYIWSPLIHAYGPPSSIHMVPLIHAYGPPHPCIWSPLIHAYGPPHPCIWSPPSMHMVPLIHAYGPPHPCIWSPPPHPSPSRNIIVPSDWLVYCFSDGIDYITAWDSQVKGLNYTIDTKELVHLQLLWCVGRFGAIKINNYVHPWLMKPTSPRSDWTLSTGNGDCPTHDSHSMWIPVQ